MLQPLIMATSIIMSTGSGMTNKFTFLLSVVTALLLLKPTRCQRTLGNPCGGPAPASYDGTDIGRPYLVDNSTGTPVYTFLDDKDYHPPSNRSKRGATSQSFRLWPKGIVYYEFHSSLTSVEREKIYDAMRHWENKTCIRFRKMGNRLEGGILYFRGSGCCSYVGRFAFFIQPVSIHYDCSFASTVHEIGHVLGFWHEQSRPDRDKYVNIHRENIWPGYEPNFDKETAVNSLGVPYDFNSIMHYSASAFAKGDTNTISTKEKDIPFGRAPELSPLDIKQTNLLYKTRCDSRSASESESILPPPSPPPPPTVTPGRCNRKLSGMTGTFSPPDNPYRSNTDCAWLIEVPKGHYIILRIYGIQMDQPCNTATDTHIGIYFGHNSDRLYTRLCGSWSSYRFGIPGQFAYITFHTNGQTNSIRRIGFTRAEFTAQDIDECRRNYCDHGCVNSIGSYNCSCRSGYYLAGTTRCFDINECGDNNGGCSHTCVNMAGTHRCECPTGYSLLPNKRECVSGVVSCQRNNGGCDHICTDTQRGARCSCRNGYLLVNGRTCSDINECTVHDGICGNNKLCFNTEGSYLCRCLIGYNLSSDGRCRDNNECSTPNICGSNKQCTNTPGSYRCSCKSGYTERNGNCEDINECSNRTLCSGDNRLCVNVPGAYRCTCRDGYHDVNGLCEDIDECTTGVHNCESSERCINRRGHFTCKCADGYKLVNDTCEDINECDRRNRCDQLCINTEGSYLCGCNEGYNLMDDERSCEDIDECKGRNRNKLCPSDTNCVNTRGAYVCECKEGYKQLKNGTCEDIDECATGAHNCKSNERCINRPGKFSCKCAGGYKLVNDTCKDINECDRRNKCDQLCTNTEGSYLCGCNEGYSLMDDGKLCEDIDECSGRNRNRLCPSDKNCVNTQGAYDCECKEGYKQSKNGTCEDINECETDDVCQQRCVNRKGSFVCKCSRGYLLMDDGRSCQDIDECADNNGGCDDTCINTNGSYSCQCSDGLRLLPDKKSCEPSSANCIPGSLNCRTNCDEKNSSCCLPGLENSRNGKFCKDINECGEGVNRCEQQCVNTVGSFHCDCLPGYMLRNNQRNCKDINECRINNGGCDHKCQNTNGSFECSCQTHYKLGEDQKTCISICANVTMEEPTGNISTIGFPISSYPANSNCSWTINLPKQYKSVELKVDGMSIEESVNCSKDRLIIMNGKDVKSLSMGNYCGKELPPIMQSSTRAVTVNFVSDDKINKKGFSLQYKGLMERVKGMYGCNITIRENNTFALSSFPSQYTSPIDCVFSLSGPTKNHKIKVIFLYLDIQDADCSRDRIEVYDGRDVIPRYKVADICNGGIRNTEFVSSRRNMRIRYIGSTVNTYQGFHASVKFVL